MQNIGKIVQIIGAVVDIRFSKDCLPNLLNAIEVDNCLLYTSPSPRDRG